MRPATKRVQCHCGNCINDSLPPMYQVLYLCAVNSVLNINLGKNRDVLNRNFSEVITQATHTYPRRALRILLNDLHYPDGKLI